MSGMGVECCHRDAFCDGACAWLRSGMDVQDGITPLYDACSRGDTAIVKVLVAAPSVNPNIPRSV